MCYIRHLTVFMSIFRYNHLFSYFLEKVLPASVGSMILENDPVHFASKIPLLDDDNSLNPQPATSPNPPNLSNLKTSPQGGRFTLALIPSQTAQLAKFHQPSFLWKKSRRRVFAVEQVTTSPRLVCQIEAQGQIGLQCIAILTHLPDWVPD